MTNRKRIINAIKFRENDYTPYDISFTGPMYDKMKEYTQNPNFGETINNHISYAYPGEPTVEIKPGYFRDEFGVIWNRTVDRDIGVIDNELIGSPEDINNFVFPEVNEAVVRREMENLQAKKDDNFHMVNYGFTMFERAWTLCGMENLLCYMISEPDFVHRLLDKICERNLKIISIANEYDYDGFIFGDDWGQQSGLIMGPKLWREFIKPQIQKMYTAVKSAGHFVAQHSCGDIREIIDDCIEIGLDVYQTFQPEIYGLDYAKKLVGRLAIWGGISTQMDLPCKAPDEIAGITRRTLRAFSEGGLIAAPTHAVPADVPPENILAMIDVLRNQVG